MMKGTETAVGSMIDEKYRLERKVQELERKVADLEETSLSKDAVISELKRKLALVQTSL